MSPSLSVEFHSASNYTFAMPRHFTCVALQPNTNSFCRQGLLGVTVQHNRKLHLGAAEFDKQAKVRRRPRVTWPDTRLSGVLSAITTAYPAAGSVISQATPRCLPKHTCIQLRQQDLCDRASRRRMTDEVVNFEERMLGLTFTQSPFFSAVEVLLSSSAR